MWGAFRRADLAAIMVCMLSGGYHEVRFQGWRRIAFMLTRPTVARNLLGWLNCSIPGTQGRLDKVCEPWRWRQAD